MMNAPGIPTHVLIFQSSKLSSGKSHCTVITVMRGGADCNHHCKGCVANACFYWQLATDTLDIAEYM